MTQTTTDLAELIDTIALIDGKVSIRDLPPREIAALADKVVWAFTDRVSPNYECRFGGDVFRAQGELDSLNIATGHAQFDFEVKATLLLLRHIGLQEGGRPLKWTTVRTRVTTLRRFGAYCAARNLRSFRGLDDLPSLKLRNMLFGFFMDESSNGGLDIKKFGGNHYIGRTALNVLISYGLVTSPEFLTLLDAITLTGMEDQKRNTQRHSIVPTGVMKTLIAQAARYVEAAEGKYDEFAMVFRDANSGIVEHRTRDWDQSIRKTRRKAITQLRALLADYFEDLQLHAYALVLAFTGMRDNEVGSLKTGCGGYKVEDGVPHYYIKSLLSKTDDLVIPLDWVANDLAYKAVSLLAKLNELFYERARLLQEHYGDSMSEHHQHSFEHGLLDQFLFGVQFAAGSVSFINYTRSAGSNSHLRLSRYQFSLSEQDVSQLELLECNYRSVAAYAKDRCKPYRPGDIFKPTAHQFRHTFAWFVVANRLGDIDDIKYQFKHLRQAMTLIYTERGFQSLNELRSVIEDFETIVNGLSIKEIVESAANNTIAGGGGERLAKMLQQLNAGAGDDVYGTAHQPHFKDMREVIAFTTRHSESIRGLPHGYCAKGPTCKIKNAADPSHCLYCDTYFATPKHLPYWKTIRFNCETKISQIEQLPSDGQQQYQAFRQSLEDNLFAANKIIARLSPASASAKEALL